MRNVGHSHRPLIGLLVNMCLGICLPIGMGTAIGQNASAPPTTAPAASATQAGGQQPYTLQTGTSLILVPATVDLKGQILYGLKPEQFALTDDGVPHRFRLEDQPEGIGLSLVVLVQCSRSAVAEYGKIEQLPTMVESLVGGAPHEVALVRYGSHPELVQPFTRKLEKVGSAMRGMGPCDDNNAATMDALSYAASILENRDSKNRRAVLLISETRDHGSKIKEPEVIAQLGRNNIVVDAFAFSPYRDDLGSEVKHGGGSIGGTAINLLLAAVQALRQNVPKTVARLSGGDYDNFATKRGFEDGVNRLTNRIHNYYLLSFTVPGGAEAGLHELKLSIPEYPKATIRARRNYWVGPPPGDLPAGIPNALPEVGAPVTPPPPPLPN